MLSPTGVLRTEGFPYALDNGAWTAFQHGSSWDGLAFQRALTRFGKDADFVVAPDIVAGGMASLAKSLEWLPRLLSCTEQVLLAVQDGMVFPDLAPHVGPRVGVFVGGSTEWKLPAIRAWGPWCARMGVWCHVGRVNTIRRIRSCGMAGVTSFDGSSASRYSKTLPFLDEARRQMCMDLGFDHDITSTCHAQDVGPSPS